MEAKNELSQFIGKTLTEIKLVKGDEDYILFITQDGANYEMSHSQECCERVYVEDICGDLEDLVNSPILLAEEVCNDTDTPPYDAWIFNKNVDYFEYQWTFYKFVTNKGSVTIRWYGESNGCYAMGVSLYSV